jgi:MFS family permease
MGLLQTFVNGVYGTSIGRTQRFGEDAKSLVGLHGIVNGVGGLIGGLTFSFFGKYLTRIGRHYVMVFGCFLHIGASFIAFLDLPETSPIENTNGTAYINPISQDLVIFGSFLLGMGTSCFINQVYSLIADKFRDDSAAVFAIYQFVSSMLVSAGYLYSNQLEMAYQLSILVFFCIFGTITFCCVELDHYMKNLQSKMPNGNPAKQI